VALELASTIKQGRRNVMCFLEATADEFANAFQQLRLQPVYATHSSDPRQGIEAVNEALKLLEAGELALTFKELEDELAAL
jgi:hypothetical protein